MTKDERLAQSRSTARRAAQAGSDRVAMLVGGYAAGRFMRKSEIQGQPAPLVLGVVGLFGMRRAKSAGGQATRLAMAGLIGAGAYGAGKIGEKHGEEAGNDGNLFSWSSEGGVKTD